MHAPSSLGTALPLISCHKEVLYSIVCAPMFDCQTHAGKVANPMCKQDSEGGTGQTEYFLSETHF